MSKSDPETNVKIFLHLITDEEKISQIFLLKDIYKYPEFSTSNKKAFLEFYERLEDEDKQNIYLKLKRFVENISIKKNSQKIKFKGENIQFLLNKLDYSTIKSLFDSEIYSYSLSTKEKKEKRIKNFLSSYGLSKQPDNNLEFLHELSNQNLDRIFPIISINLPVYVLTISKNTIH